MIFSRILFITVFSGALLFSLPARAFTIQPVRYRMTIDPGGRAVASVTVLNDEAAPHYFRASVAGVEQDSAGRPLFGNSFDAAEQWVKPEVGSFFLKPGEKKTIVFTINAPPEADPGSHFLALVIEPVGAKSGAVGLSARSAALLSLAVSGVVNEAVSIERFESLARFSAAGEWPLEAVLKNIGTVSLKLDGALIVKNAIGEIVSGQEASLGGSLLPQSIRAVAPRIELDRAKLRLPGWYTIDLAVHYGLSRSIAEARAVVWYIPFWSLAVALGLSGIIFLVLFRKYHSKKQV